MTVQTEHQAAPVGRRRAIGHGGVEAVGLQVERATCAAVPIVFHRREDDRIAVGPFGDQVRGTPFPFDPRFAQLHHHTRIDLQPSPWTREEVAASLQGRGDDRTAGQTTVIDRHRRNRLAALTDDEFNCHRGLKQRSPRDLDVADSIGGFQRRTDTNGIIIDPELNQRNSINQNAATRRLPQDRQLLNVVGDDAATRVADDHQIFSQHIGDVGRLQPRVDVQFFQRLIEFRADPHEQAVDVVVRQNVAVNVRADAAVGIIEAVGRGSDSVRGTARDRRECDGRPLTADIDWVIDVKIDVLSAAVAQIRLVNRVQIDFSTQALSPRQIHIGVVANDDPFPVTGRRAG